MKISRANLYGFLFAICVSVTYLNNFELTIAIWSITAVLTFSGSYSIALLKYVSAFTAILGIALIVSFWHDHHFYFFIRDFTYIVKPIVGLVLGYQFCREMYSKGFQVVVYTGVFIAVIHLCLMLYAIAVLHAFSMNDIRLRAGYFSDYEIYVLIILMFHSKFNLGFTKKRLWLFTAILAMSSFMYLARTNFIQFAILYIGMKGFLKINKTSIIVVSSLVTMTVIGYSAIVYSAPKRNGPGLEGLMFKIKNAPKEAFKTKIDPTNWKDFNDNYRSYENIQTVRQVTGKGDGAIIFGEGLGSQVDLKQKIWLGDMLMRFISILHNGYMTVFLKAGLLGIFIYLYSIFFLMRNKVSALPIVNNINLLLVASGVFLIFSSWVFMGLYNLIDNKSILLGFLFCYKSFAERRTLSTVQND